MLYAQLYKDYGWGPVEAVGGDAVVPLDGKLVGRGAINRRVEEYVQRHRNVARFVGFKVYQAPGIAVTGGRALSDYIPLDVARKNPGSRTVTPKRKGLVAKKAKKAKKPAKLSKSSAWAAAKIVAAKQHKPGTPAYWGAVGAIYARKAK